MIPNDSFQFVGIQVQKIQYFPIRFYIIFFHLALSRPSFPDTIFIYFHPVLLSSSSVSPYLHGSKRFITVTTACSLLSILTHSVHANILPRIFSPYAFYTCTKLRPDGIATKNTVVAQKSFAKKGGTSSRIIALSRIESLSFSLIPDANRYLVTYAKLYNVSLKYTFIV